MNVKANGGNSAAEKEGPKASSQFPGSLWSFTGCSFLNKSKKFLNTLWVFSELGEVLRAAICCYELMARIDIQGAIHNNMLNCLEYLTPQASNLICSVLRVETLGIFLNKNTSCNDAVKGWKGETCKLSFSIFLLLVLEGVVSFPSVGDMSVVHISNLRNFL